MSEATIAALDTNELLEHITSFLPIERIVQAQQVCKHWQVLIRRSTRLRRCMFRDWEVMEPYCIMNEVVPCYKDNLYLNPLLVEHTKHIPFIGEYNINEILGSPFRKLLDLEDDDTDDPVEVLRRTHYRKQFVTQPACTVMQFTVLDMERVSLHTSGFITNEDGITLGDAAAIISSVWSQQDVQARFKNLERFLGQAIELSFADMKKARGYEDAVGAKTSEEGSESQA